MNRWQERFDNHAIHGTLKELQSFASKDFEASEEEQIIEKRRFLKIIESFQNDLKKIDPEIIPYQILDNINNQLRADPLFPQIQAYSTSGRAKHIRNANEHLNVIIPLFSSLYPQASNLIEENPLRGLEKTFDNFVSAVSSEKEKLKEQIQKLNEQINQQSVKLNELSTDVDNRKKEINELIANWQAQFSEGQDKRQKDYSETIKKHREETAVWLAKTSQETASSVNDAIEKHNDALEQNQAEFSQKISAYLKEAEDKHKAILELYELTAGDSVASAYLKSANDEKDAANLWRRISIGFVIGTVIWLILSYFLDNLFTDAGNILWFKAVKSLSITAALLFGAIYSAKQSNAHRVNERQTRWFALEIKAIDPFISSLNIDDQKQLKNKLTDKLFGQQSRANDKDMVHANEHFLEVIFKGIVDIIKVK